MRVIDHRVKIRVKAEGAGVALAYEKMSMDPFDEIAVEEVKGSVLTARAAVDAGVARDLYRAGGMSGAIQRLAGMVLAA